MTGEFPAQRASNAKKFPFDDVTIVCVFPANTKRNKHVKITPKRRFDVIFTCLLRYAFAGLSSDETTSNLASSNSGSTREACVYSQSNIQFHHCLNKLESNKMGIND